MSTVRIKICGLTRVRDVQAAVVADADALGFVFARSPRKIGPDWAAELVAGVPVGKVRVGLFMDQPVVEIRAVLERVPLDLLQFHGAESNAYCRGFGKPFLKAVSMTAGNAAAEALKYPDAAGILFDSHGGSGGGTGQTFDWQALPGSPHPVWLAGGLHAGNVAAAIRATRPFAVDVSSGVEDAPGIKNAEKIAAFAAAVRATKI